MVIDTSAMMSMIRREPEAEPFARAVRADPKRLVSVISLVEAGIVVERQFRAVPVRQRHIHAACLRIGCDPQGVDVKRARRTGGCRA